MIIGNEFAFAKQQSLSTNSDVISTNVYDAGSAKKLFSGTRNMKVAGYFNITAGTSPTVRARLVGADNAGLTTNPVILDDTGVQSLNAAGSALATGDTVPFELHATMQQVPKEFYGVIWTLGGTTPTADGYANGVIDAQESMLRLKAAVP